MLRPYQEHLQQWARATQRKDDKVIDCHGHANFLRTQSAPQASHYRALKIGEPRAIHADVLRQSQIDDSKGVGEVEKDLIEETAKYTDRSRRMIPSQGELPLLRASMCYSVFSDAALGATMC
jgi:hypothetical protein